MKKLGSIILLSLYLFSMVQMMVPVLSFYLNHEYIKTHHCLSLTQPEFYDCDGFCYLKKQIEEHDHDMDHHGTNTSNTTVAKVPFVYLLQLLPNKEIATNLTSKQRFLTFNEPIPNLLFVDLSTPPPRA